MNNTRFSIIFGICVGLLLLAACATSPQPPMTTATTPVSLATAIAPKTTTVPPISSLTVTPRKFGPTSTHFPTATPPPVLPTPLVPIPTLTNEQERVYIETMLETNGGCELPCLWGISPGESTLQVLRKFNAFYSQPFSQPDGSVLYAIDSGEMIGSAGNTDYYVDTGITDLNGIVLRITVYGENRARAQGTGFVRAWQHYSLDEILTRYGVPSQIWIQFSPPAEVGATPGYGITLVYEKQNFLINYIGSATYAIQEDIVHACPSLANTTRITVQSQHPNASTRFPLFRRIDPVGYDRTLQEATGMNLDDFYNKFKTSANHDCLKGAPTLP